MKFVLYTSTLSEKKYDVNPVLEIIKTSRGNNVIRDISGVLMFDGQNFTQYIEGEGKEIYLLMQKIIKDDRHERIELLQSGYLNSRIFHEWGLGYIDSSGNSLHQNWITARKPRHVFSFQKLVKNYEIQ